MPPAAPRAVPRRARRVSTSTSQVPFEPSVQMRCVIAHPQPPIGPSVAPESSSTSSACAPIARARAGTGRFVVMLKRRPGARGRRGGRRPTRAVRRRARAARARAARPRRGAVRTNPARTRSRNPQSMGTQQHVGPVSVPIGHERHPVEVTDRGEVERARQVGVGDDHALVPRVAEVLDAVGDRAVEPAPGTPDDLRAGAARPVAHSGVVADDGDVEPVPRRAGRRRPSSARAACVPRDPTPVRAVASPRGTPSPASAPRHRTIGGQRRVSRCRCVLR